MSESIEEHLKLIHEFYVQAKEELDQHETSDALLSFAANIEDEARQMAELLEQQRDIESKPDDWGETPNLRYSMLIQWSDEDHKYLVTLPEWANVNSGGPSTHGDTYEDAARMGQECLELLVSSHEEELEGPIPDPDVYVSEEEALEIERKWEALLNSPESLAYAEKKRAELEADREAGRLIPGGFDGKGEFTDELKEAVKTLIGYVLQGMMERNQTYMAVWIHERLDELTEDEEPSEQ